MSLQQDIQIVPLPADAHLVELLGLQQPAFSRGDPFRQLQYIEKYVRDLGCQAMLLESHYVDRDYIEDHSLFYSRSFSNYPNYCRRLHFFRAPPEELKARLAALEDLCSTAGLVERTARWGEFSEACYLGFAVIKPLHGSPVGRTVLRCFAPTPDDTCRDRREFPAARRYVVHLGAVELQVTGLAFQQQDVGVSACATTALWSALHKLRDFEEIGSPTPAQITTLATQYSLPFGRPMPSDEGLSLDQMCQALQALKVAPSLLHVDSFQVTRAYVHAALRSGFAPVLVLQARDDQATWHAVTVVGYRRAETPTPQPGEAYDLSGDIVALYVHDDRVGPYQRVDPFEHVGRLGLAPHYRQSETHWIVHYVLVPLHAKIRVSVSGLREIAIESLDHVARASGGAPAATTLAVTFENWIARPAAYLQALFSSGNDSGAALARQLIARVSMPRYMGVVRLAGPTVGVIDVLIDTTSTMKNLNVLAVAHHGHATDGSVLKALGTAYRCEVFSPLSGMSA